MFENDKIFFNFCSAAYHFLCAILILLLICYSGLVVLNYSWYLFVHSWWVHLQNLSTRDVATNFVDIVWFSWRLSWKNLWLIIICPSIESVQWLIYPLLSYFLPNNALHEIVEISVSIPEFQMSNFPIPFSMNQKDRSLVSCNDFCKKIGPSGLHFSFSSLLVSCANFSGPSDQKQKNSKLLLRVLSSYSLARRDFSTGGRMTP